MLEKKLHIDALFAFYGKMLTEKQYEIMDYYCNMDYSLGEISELLSISRQAVHDAIKRTEKILEHYEETLGLYERFSEKQETFEALLEMLNQYEASPAPALLDNMKKKISLEIENR